MGRSPYLGCQGGVTIVILADAGVLVLAAWDGDVLVVQVAWGLSGQGVIVVACIHAPVCQIHGPPLTNLAYGKITCTTQNRTSAMQSHMDALVGQTQDSQTVHSWQWNFRSGRRKI